MHAWIAPRPAAMMLTALAIAALPMTGRSLADSIEIVSARDNTLIEDAEGDVSNGEGIGVFSGRVGATGGGLKRRAVLWFDVAGQLPAGSIIQSVELTLTVTQSNSGKRTFALHRLLNDWGEGESSSPGGSGDTATENDATWLHTFYPDAYWDNEGGDYDTTASASASVGDFGPLTFSTNVDLVADVQGWVDDPASEFGWLVRGDESGPSTVKRFASREWVAEPDRPMLVIQFEPGTGLPGDLDGDGTVGPADLAILLGGWGPCMDPPAACIADLNEDGVVGPADLAILLGNWS